MTKLEELYKQAAEMCVSEGVVIDDKPNGAVHRWVKRNIEHRPDTAFFIVLGVCHEMHQLTRKPATVHYCQGQMEFPFLAEVKYHHRDMRPQ